MADCPAPHLLVGHFRRMATVIILALKYQKVGERICNLQFCKGPNGKRTAFVPIVIE